MKIRNKILSAVPAIVLGLGLAIPALAEETTVSPAPPAAGTSMHQAGEDTESAVKNTAQGAVTAVNDTRITTEVKTSLATAKDLRSGQIHVNTTAGVVTLDGTVNNSEVVARAEAIAKNADGVRSVTNDLRVDPSVPLN